MLWFRTASRPRPVLRTRLRLESLDGRAVPSGLGDGEPPLLGEPIGGTTTPIAVAPRIINFTAVEDGTGWFRFTGQVVDSVTVGGLTVTITLPSLATDTATTAADGTFSVLVRVQTDGSDHGTAKAQTTADGLASNVAEVEIDPTP